jgi:hypothetical protein
MSAANRQPRAKALAAGFAGGAAARRTLVAVALASAFLGATPTPAAEPTRPPGAVVIFDPDSADGVAELTISWKAGDGDGTIVLMKQGAPVDADPVDGIQHVGSAVFGSGEEIGTGNFVVFLGAGTQVTVGNLESDVPYFVSLYAKNGSGGAIDYLQSWPEEKTSGHNASHAIDCADCHFNPAGGAAHGGFSVPRGAAQATVCKTCHNPTGVASNKAAVDIHTGPNFGAVVDCGSCHEIHNSANSLIATDPHTGGATAANRQWIRTNTAKYVPAAQEPALFQGRCTGDGALSCNSDRDCIDASAGTCDSTAFFAFDDASSPWNGLCQSCHTLTGSLLGTPESRHTNDSVTAPPSPPLNHGHEVGGACTVCHSHEGQQGSDDGFTPQGGNCTACHNQPREIGQTGTFRRQIVAGISARCTGDGSTVCSSDADCAAVGGSCTNGEFGIDFTSHHVNDGTGAQIATPWDCVVCHAEGDVLTASPDSAYHQKDGVQLKNVDTGAVFADWSTLTPLERSTFCLSCHDADGASLVAGRTDPDPDATTDPLNPFNDGVTNAHEGDGFTMMCTDGRTPCARDRDCSGSDTCLPLNAPHPRGRCSVSDAIACGTGYECPAGETCEPMMVVDVASQFDTLNASHHAVLGPAYGSPAPFGSNVDGAIQGVRTDLAWDSVLDCEDCHYGSASNRLQAHGTAKARYMLRDKDGNDTLPTPSSTGNRNVICFRCHIPTGDPNNYDKSVSAYTQHVQGAHIDDTRNLFGISCLNCHGGAEFGAIHGVDGPVSDDDGGGTYNPNVFTWGSALDLISNWTPGASVTCSARADATLLGDCTQHGSKTDNAWRSGSQTRTYRAP